MIDYFLLVFILVCAAFQVHTLSSLMVCTYDWTWKEIVGMCVQVAVLVMQAVCCGMTLTRIFSS